MLSFHWNPDAPNFLEEDYNIAISQFSKSCFSISTNDIFHQGSNKQSFVFAGLYDWKIYIRCCGTLKDHKCRNLLFNLTFFISSFIFTQSEVVHFQIEVSFERTLLEDYETLKLLNLFPALKSESLPKSRNWQKVLNKDNYRYSNILFSETTASKILNQILN